MKTAKVRRTSKVRRTCLAEGRHSEAYHNPIPALDAVNQLWWELGDEGMFWGVI